MKLQIPEGEFAGYIFDCDGTLVDTMPLHFRAWSKAMQGSGLQGELSEELFYSLGGMPTRKVAQFEDAGPGFEAATAAGMKYVVVESRGVTHDQGKAGLGRR